MVVKVSADRTVPPAQCQWHHANDWGSILYATGCITDEEWCHWRGPSQGTIYFCTTLSCRDGLVSDKSRDESMLDCLWFRSALFMLILIKSTLVWWNEREVACTRIVVQYIGGVAVSPCFWFPHVECEKQTPTLSLLVNLSTSSLLYTANRIVLLPLFTLFLSGMLPHYVERVSAYRE